MSSDELTLFSYEVLGLVGRNGAAPHDLLRMARRGRMLDWAGESLYYVEPKRLARLGYLAARKEPGQTRERTVYTLTDKGLDALAAWARTPVHFPRSRARRCCACWSPISSAKRRPARACDAARRRHRPARAARRDRGRRRRPPPPAQVPAARDGFMRRLFELHLDFVDEVERELSPRRRARQPPNRRGSARRRSAACRSPTPPRGRARPT